MISGRRVVEPGLLSKELADRFNYCRSPLQLSNCWKESVSALGSFLYINLMEDNSGEIKDAAYLFKGIFARLYGYAGKADLNKCY